MSREQLSSIFKVSAGRQRESVNSALCSFAVQQMGFGPIACIGRDRDGDFRKRSCRGHVHPPASCRDLRESLGALLSDELFAVPQLLALAMLRPETGSGLRAVG